MGVSLNRKIELEKLLNKEFLEQKYIIEKLSANQIGKLIGTTATVVIRHLIKLGFDARTVKESCNLDDRKERFIETCLEKYGKPNVLSKGTSAFDKRNKTVLERYGVKNVRQSKLVKDKVGKSVSDAWKNFTDQEKELSLKRLHDGRDYWLEERAKNFDLYMKSGELPKNFCSSVESQIHRLLDEMNIPYKVQHKIGRNFFDIKIDNLLIEVQGTYWHADPNKYKANDVMKDGKLAKEIWEKDKRKKELAESKGYKIKYIWEQELLDNNPLEIIKKLLNFLEENDAN